MSDSKAEGPKVEAERAAAEGGSGAESERAETTFTEDESQPEKQGVKNYSESVSKDNLGSHG